jgi:micrococcal nuclease
VARALRRLLRLRRSLLALVILLAASALADRLGLLGYRGDDWAAFDRQNFVIVRVVDGDTVHIAPPLGGESTKVRLIGIDAPEMNFTSSASPGHWAPQATENLRQRVQDRTISIRLDGSQTRDRYGRLLAYIYLDDSLNVNLELVRQGHVYADTRFGHSHQPAFEQAEKEARQKKRGLWQDVRQEQMPAWRRKWLEETRQRKAA